MSEWIQCRRATASRLRPLPNRKSSWTRYMAGLHGWGDGVILGGCGVGVKRGGTLRLRHTGESRYPPPFALRQAQGERLAVLSGFLPPQERRVGAGRRPFVLSSVEALPARRPCPSTSSGRTAAASSRGQRGRERASQMTLPPMMAAASSQSSVPMVGLTCRPMNRADVEDDDGQNEQQQVRGGLESGVHWEYPSADAGGIFGKRVFPRPRRLRRCYNGGGLISWERIAIC